MENDRVDVPYLGTFTAELVPATYSDRQTTIHPPYRKMSFHKEDLPLEKGRPLLEAIRRKIGVSLDQAGVELGWCLSRLSSELEGRKSCKLPGLGVMRANARNEFFFVPDDDLDIWPDGIGFEPIAIKLSEKPAAEEMPGQAGHDERGLAGHDGKSQAGHDEREQAGKAERNLAGGAGAEADGFSECEHFSCEQDEKPELRSEMPGQAGHDERGLAGHDERGHDAGRLKALWIVLIVVGALLLLFIAASYLFTEQMSPILDRLLYTREELELLRGR